MIDIKNLGKRKYIYRIYETEDDVLHCEKYPIIYINSKIIYFKDARKKEYLNYIETSDVLNNFTEFYRRLWNFRPGWSPCFDKYFWNCDPDIEKIYADLLIQRDVLRKKDIEEKRKYRLEKAKKEYEAALKDIGE